MVVEVIDAPWAGVPVRIRWFKGSSHVRVWEVSEWAGVQVVAWAACPSCHQ